MNNNNNHNKRTLHQTNCFIASIIPQGNEIHRTYRAEAIRTEQ